MSDGIDTSAGNRPSRARQPWEYEVTLHRHQDNGTPLDRPKLILSHGDTDVLFDPVDAIRVARDLLTLGYEALMEAGL